VNSARHKLYTAKKPDDLRFPLEIICVDQNTFDVKSKIGGIFFVALNEGLPFIEN
jgi:hypothetical protein